MSKLFFQFWDRGFLRQVRRAGGPVMRRQDLHRMRERLPGVPMTGGDRQAAFNHRLATTLHALAELLELDHAIARPDAVRIARQAFLANGAGLTRVLIRLWLKTRANPYQDLLATPPKARMQKLWGSGLTAKQKIGADRITLQVTACTFAEYFWTVGRFDLAPILCACDSLWFETVNTGRRGLRVGRTGTLVDGAGSCTFTFARVAEAETDPHRKPLSKQRNLM